MSNTLSPVAIEKPVKCRGCRKPLPAEQLRWVHTHMGSWRYCCECLVPVRTVLTGHRISFSEVPGYLKGSDCNVYKERNKR